MGLVKEYFIEYSEDDELREMVDWFHDCYTPADQLPKAANTEEPIFLNGGPFDPHEVLMEKFGNKYELAKVGRAAEHAALRGTDFDLTENYDRLISQSERFFEKQEPPLHFFRRSIVDISDMLDGLAGNAPDVFVRMLFGNVISIIEAYLSDKFLHELSQSTDAKEQLVTQHPKFQERKLTLAQILENPNCVDDEIRFVLQQKIIWHRLTDVKMLYLKAFDIHVSDEKEWFEKAKETRHHIVHRNGRDFDGNVVALGQHHVRELIGQAENLIAYVEDCFERKKAD